MPMIDCFVAVEGCGAAAPFWGGLSSHPHPTIPTPTPPATPLHPTLPTSAQVNLHIRSFGPSQLTQVVEGLTRLGYIPRQEICSALLAQVRRHFHALTPGQLAVLMHSLASTDRWVGRHAVQAVLMGRQAGGTGSTECCVVWRPLTGGWAGMYCSRAHSSTAQHR